MKIRYSRLQFVVALVGAAAIFSAVNCGSGPSAVIPVQAVAPGNDPLVVDAERALRATTSVYDHAMTWCETNAGTIGRDARSLCVTLRDKTPRAWRAASAALEAYIAARDLHRADPSKPDPATEAANLEALVGALQGLVDQLRGLAPASSSNIEDPPRDRVLFAALAPCPEAVR